MILLAESIYGKNMVNLEQIVTSFSTVFISIGLAEKHSNNRGKSNVAKYIFFSLLKFCNFTDGAWQQEGTSLHL